MIQMVVGQQYLLKVVGGMMFYQIWLFGIKQCYGVVECDYFVIGVVLVVFFVVGVVVGCVVVVEDWYQLSVVGVG